MTRPAAAPVAAAPALTDWESEGGSQSRADRSRDGIVTCYVAHYRVGDYRYTDMGCAMAELNRQGEAKAALQAAGNASPRTSTGDISWKPNKPN